MGNTVEKKKLEGVLVYANAAISLLLVIIRLIVPAGQILDLVSVILAACCLIVASVIIKRSVAMKESKVAKYLAITMQSYACFMVIVVIALMI